MVTHQVTLSKERGAQLSRYLQTRKDLRDMDQGDAIREILFEVMDKVVPIEKEGT